MSAPTGDSVNFTRLGNVDVTFLDHSETVLGSTVTHEGLMLSPVEAPDDQNLIHPLLPHGGR